MDNKLKDSEGFVGKSEEYISLSKISDNQHQKDLHEIATLDTSDFMKNAGSRFVSGQYNNIRITEDRINKLEELMMSKAEKDDTSLDTIREVYRDLTKKNDNNAKNVLRLYAGNNAESSPLLKKSSGGDTGLSKAGTEASAEELNTMSAMAMAVRALAQNQMSKDTSESSTDTKEEE